MRPIAACLLLLTPIAATRAARAVEAPERLGLPGESIEVAGRPAFVLLPEESLRSTPQPWIFYAPTLPGYPDEHEKWMHEQFLVAGVAVAGIDVGESYGSPGGRKTFDVFYDVLTKQRGFAARPCLLARSRGGLWIASWAADHPERIAGIAAIYPVFDLRSYPGIHQAAPAYQLKELHLAEALSEHNPIERVSKLAAARIPAFIIHGEKDEVVPLEPNSGRFAEIYVAEGAKEALTLVVEPGRGHDFWEGYFRSQKLVDFAIKHASAGAAGEVAPR